MMSLAELNKENFDKEINNGITVIDFHAPWCGPCKMVNPIIEELATELTDISFRKVNIDDNQEIAVKYNIMSIPTILIFKDGKPITSSVGVVSKDALKKKIENVK